MRRQTDTRTIFGAQKHDTFLLMLIKDNVSNCNWTKKLRYFGHFRKGEQKKRCVAFLFPSVKRTRFPCLAHNTDREQTH